jgi:PPOX class probable F420-dependent enzyme
MVRPDGQPQSVPVWFLWEGETFLVYSQPRRRQGKKLRNIERNPRAGLNLNSNAQGGDVVRVEGMAEIVEDTPPLTEVLEYVEEVPGRHRQDRLRPGQLRAGLLRRHPGDARALASLVA